MTATSLLPEIGQYGYLDELGLRAVQLAQHSRSRRIVSEQFQYGDSKANFRMIRSIRTPGFKLGYFRSQGVLEGTGLNNMAALSSITFPATNISVYLTNEYYDMCVNCGIDSDFRPVGCFNQFTRYKNKFDKIPAYLTPRGWEVGEGEGEVRFCVTAEVFSAVASHLKMCLDQIESGSPNLTVSGPEIIVHKCRPEFYPGPRRGTNAN